MPARVPDNDRRAIGNRTLSTPSTGAVGVKDVARHAGVSLGTVSNVLNRPEVVSPPTRRKVLAAITELGFVRNEAARQLRADAAGSSG